MRFFAAVALVLFATSLSYAEGLTRVSHPLPPGMTRADLWVMEANYNPRAILVLCPGMNSDSKSLVKSPTWQKFARDNHLGLVGISFASLSSDLYAERGYTFPDQGSGDLLLKTIKDQYGSIPPLLLYGFSSGAYFTELFVAWKPKMILSWAAHATGRYDEYPGQCPPGIVSCGEKDASRLGPALTHFKKGRSVGNKLLWVGLPEIGHGIPEKLDDFVMSYFRAIIYRNGSSTWVDIDTHKELLPSEAEAQPSLSAWLPSKSLLKQWRNLCNP